MAVPSGFSRKTGESYCFPGAKIVAALPITVRVTRSSARREDSVFGRNNSLLGQKSVDDRLDRMNGQRFRFEKDSRSPNLGFRQKSNCLFDYSGCLSAHFSQLLDFTPFLGLPGNLEDCRGLLANDLDPLLT